MNLIIVILSLLMMSSGWVNAMEQPSGFQGDYFTAIPIPENIKYILADIQKELARCLGNDFSASPLDNLHITIQVMEGRNEEKMKQGLKNVSSPFKQWAKSKGWDKDWHFESKLQDSHIEIGNKGHVKLHIAKSDLLIELGRRIEHELNKIVIKTNRNDVAGTNYTAHITLGMVSESRVSQARSKKCTIDSKKRFAGSRFIVDRFVLLQSNRPAKVRRYAQRGEFPLNLGK